MRNIRQQFLNLLTPGVRVLLGLLSLVYVAAIIGKASRLFDLSACLSLTGRGFLDGQVWRIITYVLIPVGLVDFIVNGFALLLLGSLWERNQSRGALWMVVFAATIGSGLAKVALIAISPLPLVGSMPMGFGLLAAWCVVCGHAKILAPPIGEVTVWQLALLVGGLSLVAMACTAGLANALIILCGGLSGGFYVWLSRKWFMKRAARTVHSERISRLEL